MAPVSASSTTPSENISAEKFRDEMTGLLVQRMVPDGVEMLVGALHDPTFGPVVACGSGDVPVDLLGDLAFRIHPLTQKTRPR
jgi:acetate---CoA ligase (ADP-forming)